MTLTVIDSVRKACLSVSLSLSELLAFTLTPRGPYADQLSAWGRFGSWYWSSNNHTPVCVCMCVSAYAACEDGPCGREQAERNRRCQIIIYIAPQNRHFVCMCVVVRDEFACKNMDVRVMHQQVPQHAYCLSV